MKQWEHARRSNTGIYALEFEDGAVILRAANAASLRDIGAVKQVASSEICRGKRVRFQAEVSTQDADGAGLWLGAATRDVQIMDAMYNRLITGSSEWKNIELVIDVPSNAEYVSYGLWMKGSGCCLMRNPQFDFVDQSVPLTQYSLLDRIASDRWVERAN